MAKKRFFKAAGKAAGTLAKLSTIAVLALVFGLVLAGCPAGDDGGDDNGGNTFKVTITNASTEGFTILAYAVNEGNFQTMTWITEGGPWVVGATLPPITLSYEILSSTQSQTVWVKRGEEYNQKHNWSFSSDQKNTPSDTKLSWNGYQLDVVR